MAPVRVQFSNTSLLRLARETTSGRCANPEEAGSEQQHAGRFWSCACRGRLAVNAREDSGGRVGNGTPEESHVRNARERATGELEDNRSEQERVVLIVAQVAMAIHNPVCVDDREWVQLVQGQSGGAGGPAIRRRPKAR